MTSVGASDEQVALNETTFREVNEGIEAGRREREGLVPFVCECGEVGCNADTGAGSRSRMAPITLA